MFFPKIHVMRGRVISHEMLVVMYVGPHLVAHPTTGTRSFLFVCTHLML
jgi:hypothetical protein